ncbi:substrate-binding domain-containing protein [Geobacillus stearothermophilus]|uniref:substrate-binding domain-containing protein n=1 Tax=Geobacillus thermoleovorans group TaxID=1505648 RepID=UPI0010BF242A|nr:substrate-binding domain-containing protein [Geobacillus kaustophilus]MED4971843.1 substrate-binding domain-containing protein [Geobacillus thermoleovorans]QCK83067.1 LacI family DNA-binding transcriptional regulator [Geobacillus kaustophilus NBRC 102445]WJP98986.1 substrate-binding domain-containing protein [Geobacillus stearothermophilus]WJQ02274.1 substrate-binding domain-containing protein [Geobacillus stearothermophilus]
MKQRVTMRDIARKLGVSSVTVSKALNDKEGVSEELRKKIKETAREMGYRLNTLTKAMKEGYSYNVGVVIPERFIGDTQSFYLRFYQHIAKALDHYGYCSILHILTAEDEEQLQLPRVYNERKVDGFIMLGQVNKEYASLFQQIELPVVFLDFYHDQDVDCVLTDNFFGMYELTNHLIQCGHREIAFVGNIYSTSSIQDRFLGYYKSLLEHRIPLREEYIISDRDEKGKYIDFVLPKNMPTAFVCNCDQVAYHLVHTLKELGYRVPEDCSVVGFDNDIYATLAEPNLTTVQVNMEEMSDLAVKMIIEKSKDRNKKYGRVLVKGQIIYRDSVQRIND